MSSPNGALALRSLSHTHTTRLLYLSSLICALLLVLIGARARTRTHTRLPRMCAPHWCSLLLSFSFAHARLPPKKTLRACSRSVSHPSSLTFTLCVTLPDTQARSRSASYVFNPAQDPVSPSHSPLPLAPQAITVSSVQLGRQRSLFHTHTRLPSKTLPM